MLAAADVGLVTLDPRVATGSVPSKAFTIMAAGRPVLAAIDERNQVAAEIRHAECGEVVPPNGVNEMAKTLRGWADDPLTLDALGSRGRRWAERFHDRESAVREYEGLFARIAGPKREEEPRRPTRTC